MFNFGPDLVEFCLLIDRKGDWSETLQALKSEGVEVIRENAKVSDYVDCRTSRRNFCRIFKTRLKYKTMKVGAFELKKPGEIPPSFPIKLVALKRDIMLPPKFVTKTTIERRAD